MRALGSSKEETGTVRECSRAGQYRLSCTGQFFEISCRVAHLLQMLTESAFAPWLHVFSRDQVTVLHSPSAAVRRHAKK